MIRVLLVDDQALVRSGFRIILESEPDIEVVGEAANGAAAVRLATELQPDVICMDVEMPELNGIEAARRILRGAAGSNAEPSAGSEAGSQVPRGAENAAAAAGAAAAARVEARPAILILTTFGHDAYLFDALAAGVSGFLLKTARAEQLIEAVRTLAAGQALLGPDITRAVMERAAGIAAIHSGEGAGSTGGDTGNSSAAAGRRDAPVPAGAHDDSPPIGSANDLAAEPSRAAGEAVLEAAGLTEREREVLRLVATGRSNGEIAAALFLGEATVKTHVSNLLQKLGVRDRVQAVVWAHTNGVVPGSSG